MIKNNEKNSLISGNKDVAETVKPAKSMHKLLLSFVIFVQFLLMSDFMMLMPMAPDIALDLDFKVENFAWLTGIYTAMAVLSGVIGAVVLDKVNQRKTIVVLLCVHALLMMACFWVEHFSHLFILRCLAGLISAPLAALLLSFVISSFSLEERGKAMAKMALSFSLSAIVGVPLGLELGYQLGWRLAFVIMAIPLLFMGISAWFVLPKTCQKSSGRSFNFTLLKQQPALFVGMVLMASTTFSVFLFIPHLSSIFQFNYDFAREDIGQLYLLGGLVTIVITQVFGAFVARLNLSLFSGYLALGFIGIVVAGFSAAPLLPVLAVFVLFMSINSVRNLMVQYVVSKIPEPAARTGYMSAIVSVRNVFTGLASVVSSFILVTTPEKQLANVDWLIGLSVITILCMPFCIMYLTHQTRPEH